MHPTPLTRLRRPGRVRLQHDGGSAPARQPRCLVLFSGPDERQDGLPAASRRRGFHVTAIDTKVGGAQHDVTKSHVRASIEARVRACEFDAVFFGTPCESVSVAHRPQLRSRKQPAGLRDVPKAWRLYLAKHNAFIA